MFETAHYDDPACEYLNLDVCATPFWISRLSQSQWCSEILLLFSPISRPPEVGDGAAEVVLDEALAVEGLYPNTVREPAAVSSPPVSEENAHFRWGSTRWRHL